MTTSISPTLKHYEFIATLSHRMLHEARQQHWDQLIELGQQYAKAIEHLKTINQPNASERDARRQLLNQILEDDAQIRQLAEPELKRLKHLLGDMKRQETVVNAYCSPSFST